MNKTNEGLRMKHSNKSCGTKKKEMMNFWQMENIIVTSENTPNGKALKAQACN